MLLKSPKTEKKVRKPREIRAGKKYRDPETGGEWVDYGVSKKKKWFLEYVEKGGDPQVILIEEVGAPQKVCDGIGV